MLNSQNYFDQFGRRIPFEGMRVFNKVSRQYYKLKNPIIDYANILTQSQSYGCVDKNIDTKLFKYKCDYLREDIISSSEIGGIFNGIHVPFICANNSSEIDVGEEMEDTYLPAVGKSFKSYDKENHFKVILQGGTHLPGNINIDERSNYQNFINARKKSTLVGWYFPQALQEFDIESQRAQMSSLHKYNNLCLSGGFDIAAALIGTPGLLINSDGYPPILCLSAFQYSDKRLMLSFKSYGPHLEFWCMSQMLFPDVTQVSEQWSGGLTVFGEI